MIQDRIEDILRSSCPADAPRLAREISALVPRILPTEQTTQDLLRAVEIHQKVPDLYDSEDVDRAIESFRTDVGLVLSEENVVDVAAVVLLTADAIHSLAHRHPELDACDLNLRLIILVGALLNRHGYTP